MDRYQIIQGDLTKATPEQKELHAKFEGRFSGDTSAKADIPALAPRDYAFHRFGPEDLVRRLLRYYKLHNLNRKLDESKEVFILGYPKVDPRIVRLEVLPLDNKAGFYLAAKKREGTKNPKELELNELELGHDATTAGYETVHRVYQDVEILLRQLRPAVAIEDSMPSFILRQDKNHPIHERHNPGSRNIVYATMNNLYESSVIKAQSGSGDRAIELRRFPTSSLKDVLSITDEGIKQEFVDAYGRVMGYLPLDGEVKISEIDPSIINIKPFERGLPGISLTFDDNPGRTVTLSYASEHKQLADVAKETLMPLTLLANRYRRD